MNKFRTYLFLFFKYGILCTFLGYDSTSKGCMQWGGEWPISSGVWATYVRGTKENKNGSKLGLPSDRMRLPEERNHTFFPSDTVLPGNVLGLPPLVIQFREIHNLAATRENSTIKLLIEAKQNKTKTPANKQRKKHTQPNPQRQFAYTHRDIHILGSCLHLRRKEKDWSEAGVYV